jgi:hypothetical protein
MASFCQNMAVDVRVVFFIAFLYCQGLAIGKAIFAV